jgi:hypothetical protein
MSGQFKKGQSGNPSGRRKRSRLFSDRILEALNETVTINEAGRKRTITKGEALAKQVANKGASGDLKSIKFLFEILAGIEPEPVATSQTGHHQNISAREVLMQRIALIRERADETELYAKDKSFA